MLRQREMEELASSLSQTLSLHFPEGPPAHDESLVKRWLGELAQATASDDSNMTATEIMRLAVEQWKTSEPCVTKEATKDAVTSFSLLDQFSSMPKRVFFDDIEAASTPAEQLALLQQVDHVDDVASDWKKVLEILFVGLTEGNSINEYIQLHCKWFAQCASCAEYTSLQFGLCSNLVKALRHVFGSHVFVSESTGLEFTDQQQLVFEMIQQWHAMWLSSMKNFRMDDCNQMMLEVMQLMRNLAPASPASFVLLPAHLFALVDPYADWFALWMEHAVLPGDAVESLLSSGLFHDLLQRCLLQGHVAWETQPDVGKSNVVMIQEGQDVQVLQLERALWEQSLCMLRSILVSARVAIFPWDKVRDGATFQVPHTCLLALCPPAETETKVRVRNDAPLDDVRSVIGCFLKMIQDKTAGTTIRAICFEGVETILLGLQNDEKFGIILSNVLSSLESCKWQGKDVVVFATLVRLYRSRDWTGNIALQERLTNFLSAIKSLCGAELDDLEFAEFEVD